MSESPLYFNSQGQQAFGVLHLPEAERMFGAYVLCSPFGEEKLWTHRVFVNFSRELANRGYASLRFDYMGHGDSEGLFRDADIQSRLADIRSAIAFVRERLGDDVNLSLLGMRLGGTLVSLVAEEEPGLRGVVLWEPLVDGPAYMKELFRINLTTQTAVYREIRLDTKALIEKLGAGHPINVDGYEITWPFYEQLTSIDLLKARKSFPGPVLIVNISRAAGRINPKLSQLSDTYDRCLLEQVQEEPFWKEVKAYYSRAEVLYRETLKWIVKHEE